MSFTHLLKRHLRTPNFTLLNKLTMAIHAAERAPSDKKCQLCDHCFMSMWTESLWQRVNAFCSRRRLCRPWCFLYGCLTNSGEAGNKLGGSWGERAQTCSSRTPRPPHRLPEWVARGLAAFPTATANTEEQPWAGCQKEESGTSLHPGE